MKKLIMGRLGQVEGVGGLIALLVMIAIGALVTYEVTGAAKASAATATGDSYAENAIGNVEARGATVFNLLTILAIVFVAALIIGVVIRALGGAAGPAQMGPAL